MEQRERITVKKLFGLAFVLVAGLATLSGCFMLTPPEDLQPQLLFADNFANASSPGWWQGIDPPGEWEIRSGHFYGGLSDEDSYYYVHNTTVTGLTDFRIEATTNQLGSASDHSWGIIFRAQGEDFYAFEISADGYILFSVRADDFWDDIIDWEASDAIHPAGQTNKIRVDVRGTSFMLYVNDQLVGQATDATLTSGSVGFIVETWNDPDGSAWFDDLQVWSLPE